MNSELWTLNFVISATMPVTVNGGFRMPSWFDIYSLDKSAQQDEAGILKAADDSEPILIPSPWVWNAVTCTVLGLHLGWAHGAIIESCWKTYKETILCLCFVGRQFKCLAIGKWGLIVLWIDWSILVVWLQYSLIWFCNLQVLPRIQKALIMSQRTFSPPNFLSSRVTFMQTLGPV